MGIQYRDPNTHCTVVEGKLLAGKDSVRRLVHSRHDRQGLEFHKPGVEGLGWHSQPSEEDA